MRRGNFEVADPPPPLALLAGEALEYLPPGLLREWAYFAPQGPLERREPVAFASCWSLVAASCLRRVVDGNLRAPIRDFAAVAGIALANVVAGLDQDKWHAHNLDEALKGMAVTTGLDGALAVAARRVARLEYASRPDPLLRLLGRLLDTLSATAPAPQPSFEELLDRLPPSLVPVAELLRSRYPRLARNSEIERAFGKATKAFGIVGLLRKRGGLVIQNYREAVAQDPDLATVPDGYRLAPGWD